MKNEITKLYSKLHIFITALSLEFPYKPKMIECHVFVPALPISDASNHSVLCRHTAIENDAALYVANKRGFHSENHTVNSTGILLSKATGILGNENHQALRAVCFGFCVMKFYSI